MYVYEYVCVGACVRTCFCVLPSSVRRCLCKSVGYTLCVNVCSCVNVCWLSSWFVRAYERECVYVRAYERVCTCVRACGVVKGHVPCSCLCVVSITFYYYLILI